MAVHHSPVLIHTAGDTPRASRRSQKQTAMLKYNAPIDADINMHVIAETGAVQTLAGDKADDRLDKLVLLFERHHVAALFVD